MTITSKEVAEMLGKRHDNLLRAIRKYITQLGDEAPKYFSEDPDKGGRLYHITKAGCDLMAGRIIGAQSEAFKDDIVQDLKKAQEFIQFEIDAIEGARAERKDKPKHEDFMDAMLRGLFGGSVGHIEITGKRNGKTDEEIAEIVDKTIKDIISGMAGVELEEIKEGNGYTEVHITGNANPIEVREYIERELKDRLAMVL